MKRNQCNSETDFSLTTVDVVQHNVDKTVENSLERPVVNEASVMGSKKNDNTGFHGKNSSQGKEGISVGVVLNPLEFFRAPWNFKWTPQNRSDSKDREMTNSNGIDKKTQRDGGPSAGRIADKDGGADVKPIGEEMTLSRKIAFFLSFLPVIMFVVLVTVLIPCNNSPRDAPCCRNNTTLIDDAVVNGTFLA